ncbi:MAG: porin [Rhodospirillales bacterium]|nr:porin [Rhodospirillales bacterium]MCB9997030.1 porin [Rhodospirillales bacterium]
MAKLILISHTFNQTSQIFVIGDIDMKKLLLGTAAVAMGLTVVAGSAQAQVKLDLGGHVKAYTSWLDQDTTPDDPATALPNNESEDERSFDILRESEIHFSGETTLDNGLTVGVHMEADVDGTTGDNFTTEEGYAYFSGAWGRVNFGLEDGAAYLLQVAAPSADSNFDGIRQWVNPVNTNIMSHNVTSGGTLDALTFAALGNFGDNSGFEEIFGHTAYAGTENIVFASTTGNTIIYNTIGLNAASETALVTSNRFDYDQAVSGYSNKLTYMTPVFNGFQAGVSYTPELNQRSRDFGNNDDDDVFAVVGTITDPAGPEWGDTWDVAARYEGQFDEVGIAFGGGWTHAELEANTDTPILFRSANTGVPAVTGAYVAGTDQVVATFDDREAWNVGIDLDWKAFGLGAAYTEDDHGVSGDNWESETWVVGLDYTTGPFKIGASYLDYDHNYGGPSLEAERWTGGVVYTYGPGMTFRGSVSWVDLDENIGFRANSADATSVLLGTQINF